MALRFLIVEDEMTIAFMIEDMLADLGHQVVAVAMRLPEAIETARHIDVDMAILDVNLDGLRSFPVAEILADRGIPFVFATGYGAAGLDEPYRTRPILAKPFLLGDMRQLISHVIDR